MLKSVRLFTGLLPLLVSAGACTNTTAPPVRLLIRITNSSTLSEPLARELERGR